MLLWVIGAARPRRRPGRRPARRLRLPARRPLPRRRADPHRARPAPHLHLRRRADAALRAARAARRADLRTRPGAAPVRRGDLPRRPGLRPGARRDRAVQRGRGRCRPAARSSPSATTRGAGQPAAGRRVARRRTLRRPTATRAGEVAAGCAASGVERGADPVRAAHRRGRAPGDARLPAPHRRGDDRGRRRAPRAPARSAPGTPLPERLRAYVLADVFPLGRRLRSAAADRPDALLLARRHPAVAADVAALGADDDVDGASSSPTLRTRRTVAASTRASAAGAEHVRAAVAELDLDAPRGGRSRAPPARRGSAARSR